MKYTLLLLVSILMLVQLYVGCNSANNQAPVQEPVNPVNDSLTNKVHNKVSSTIDEDSMELVNIYKTYQQNYDAAIKIDTAFVFKESKVKVDFQYYCLHDSSLRLPAKYTEMYGIKDFVTHQFESTLKVRINDQPVLEIIRKKMFEDTIPVALKKYGVLLYPVLTIGKDHVAIDYSLAIPLTDVGRLVSFPIFK
ncbi:hypothetical protein [Chitinophaga nivalis]|uniref:DUF3298 domain-containing protein n=1 Tax=Chitinophaga nivalis TaxID=2991709 RepID=A0ABT3IEI3_9BACT|nr:hypothetical protein [Chitinophaga nivalis]MCW3467949.1 hypothetical protein [Chitinophaga nivalis]MCW3482360.1 hypothetical protein [Chitinophaga nivalis]